MYAFSRIATSTFCLLSSWLQSIVWANVCSLILSSSSGVVYGGIGKHMTELSPEEISTLLKVRFSLSSFSPHTHSLTHSHTRARACAEKKRKTP